MLTNKQMSRLRTMCSARHDRYLAILTKKYKYKDYFSSARLIYQSCIMYQAFLR